VIILSYWFARDAVRDNPQKLNVISVERTSPVDANLCKNHLHLKIDDIEDWHIEQFGSELKRDGIVFPEKSDIMKAVEFSKLHKVHIVHCHAGVSRSSAIAYAIFRSQGKSKQEAMKEVYKINLHAEPNTRIVRLTDEIFG
jgi:predicted protein tyrosine phosphatase